MDLNSIRTLLGASWTGTEALLKEAVNSDVPLLRETNHSLLQHGGKMMRPMLSLLVAKACGGNGGEESQRVAAAVELLHNATLLHDDVADEGTSRRGIPTVSATLGNAASVLVGDFWLSRAVSMVLSVGERRDTYIDVFAKTLSDLAEGEILQLQKAGTGDTSQDDYMKIIYCKTASLFEAACAAGAMSAGTGLPEDSAASSLEPIGAAKEYGTALGLAFQVRDDILDYVGSDHLGKPAGSDLREQKITLPLLGALLRVERDQERMVRQMVCDIHSHPDYCSRILEFVERYDGIAYASERLSELVEKACRALDPLPDSPAKTVLLDLARYTAARDV